MTASAGTLPLFDRNRASLDEKVQYMERLAEHKCKDFSVSLGYFKTKSFKRSHTSWLIVLDKNDKSYTHNLEADTFPQMVDQITDILEKL